MSVAMGILTDTTLCTGCEKCVKACKRENKLGRDVLYRWKRSIDDLSSTRYTTILRRPGNRFVRQLCRHCLHPACVSACIVGALRKTPEGAVVYDGGKCMGCRYCMMACPYGIPRYEWEKSVPYVRKCTMCYQRISGGDRPACVDACAEKATIFGPRDELIRVAQQRIEKSPDKYVKEVFGRTEVGGTSVIYLSDVPLEFLGFKPALGDRPLPELTWAALTKVPPIVIGVTALMAGVWWIIDRRMKLAAEAQRASKADASAEPPQSRSGDQEKTR